MSVSRFGVSLESDLLSALDNYILENKFPNRSQGIRHLIEKILLKTNGNAIILLQVELF